jgi:hypothetical protein
MPTNADYAPGTPHRKPSMLNGVPVACADALELAGPTRLLTGRRLTGDVATGAV